MINIKIDSRKVKPGDTFVAIPGATVDGHDYISKAILNGATKIIAEKGMYDVSNNDDDSSTGWLRKLSGKHRK